MAPLATATVLVLPNMAGFAPAVAAGVRSVPYTALGATQGAAYASAFNRSAANLLAAGAAVGFGILVKEAVQAAGNFEAAMVRLTTSAGETGTLVSGNLKIVAEGIKTMAAQVGYSVDSLGKAMYIIESAGFRAADGLNVLKFAAQAAKAENSDLTTVVDALTTVMIDYQRPASAAAQTMNTLLAAAATSKVNLNDLAKSLHSVLPAASAAGIGLDDILGALSSMTLHGYSAQQATQNLADVIRHMQRPTNVQAKELALLGLTTQQLGDSLRSSGLTGTLQMISDRIKNLMPPNGQRVLLDLQTAFSKLSPKVQDLARQLIAGTLSYADYRAAARELTPVQNAQAMSFYQLAASTHRIGDEQMTGAKVLQNYTQALAAATGDATGLNVALMLTGANAETTNDIVKTISQSTLEAGGNVKGWAAIQDTFNFKLAQTKAALGVVGVELGTTLLPVFGAVFEAITKILGPMAEWISSHQDLTAVIASSVTAFIALGTAVLVIERLVVGIRALAIAMGLVRVATVAWTATIWLLNFALNSTWRAMSLYRAGAIACASAQKIAAAASRAWAAALFVLDAAFSPIGLIVIAIIAVVAALVYAYFHFRKFRDIVDKVFRAIMVVVRLWWEYAKFAFEQYSKLIMDVIVPAAIWLWQKVLVPAFHGIVEAMKLWWEYAKFAFGALKALIMDVIVPVLVWLWEHVWGPQMKIAIIVIQAWWEYAKFVFNALKALIMDVVVPVIIWLWEHVVQPVFNAIKFFLQAWWVIIQVIFQALKIFVIGLGVVFIAFWQNYVKPAWNGVQLVIEAAWIVIKAIWEKQLQPAIEFLGKAFRGLWLLYIEPAWNGIKMVISGVWQQIEPIFAKLIDIVKVTVPSAFRDGTNLVAQYWELVKGIVANPINFVIRYVINDGIIKAWNFLADFFGVKDKIPNVPLINLSGGSSSSGGGGGGGTARAMADGGRVYGWGGGRQDAVPIMASAGEYVIPAHVVSDIGVSFFDHLIGKRKPVDKAGDGSNGIAIGHYADGGLIDFIIKGPAGWVGDRVNGFIDKIPGGGIVRDISVAASKKLVQALVDWAKDKLNALIGGDVANIPLTGDLGGIVGWLYAQNGKPYGWAQAGPNSYDCSGIISAVWNLMHGRNPYNHTFSTSNQAAFFPKVGQTGIFTVGWANPGERGGGSVGHTAGNFAGIGVESTGSRGVRIGAGTTPVTNFAHWGTFADGGMVYPMRSFDRGGRWPSGTIGINTSGRTEQVTTGGDMAMMIALLEEQLSLTRQLLLATKDVGSDVGAELSGVSSRLRQQSRLR